MAFVYLPQRLLLGGADRGGVRPLRAHFLPLRETAGELGHVPLVQDPDPRRQRAQQRPVVAHEDHRAVVSLDRVLQRLDRFDVQMIRRLVQNEQVGARQHQHRERETRALAARQ